MIYKFQHTDYQGNVLTLEFKAEGMDEVAQHVRQFLLGVGFTESTVNAYFDEF